MKIKLSILIVLTIVSMIISCNPEKKTPEVNIMFLHHSTGGVIWNGELNSKFIRIASRFSNKIASAELPSLFLKYNKEGNHNYFIDEIEFPKSEPYGWNNFPFDYYNIWVKNAGEEEYMEEPTLEYLTKEYQVIIFKHCFPVSNIEPDEEIADINSDKKTIGNYILQYLAIRDKLHTFPNTKFILFTGAVQVESQITLEEAQRAKEFYDWIINVWDLPGDNIYLWDLYRLQTEGGLFFQDEYAVSLENSHPNIAFASTVVKLLFNRIIDVIENEGNSTNLMGEKE